MGKFKFRTHLGEEVFRFKYSQGPDDTWPILARRLVEDVCGDRGRGEAPLMSRDDRDYLIKAITEMKFIPGGRYLYYAGRDTSFFSNCFAMEAEEDTREEWGALSNRVVVALMTGGGVGVNYSRLRPAGRRLRRTGGVSSGPIPLMKMMNENGRYVRQGGDRRAALWAGLNWQHEDIEDFLVVKDWPEELRRLKAEDFDFPLALDGTNTSICWDTDFIEDVLERQNVPDLWHHSVLQMCRTGEPGHSYDFFENEGESLRNACSEFVSDADSDSCNLGSINLANIENIQELEDVVTVAAKFLICGSMRGELPFEKSYAIRNEYRKIGLGLMGLHEWLLARGYKYEINDELRQWLECWARTSEKAANEHADRFFVARPKAYRAVAPAGTIGILAGTTTGIEPIYSVAYKRRYLEGERWKYQYVIDASAQAIIDKYGLEPNTIETAVDLAKDVRKRISFQAAIQEYVDMGISSTINLPRWGTEYNNEDTAQYLADTLLTYAPMLRGITVYPDGASMSQPITSVPYEEAKAQLGVIYDETSEMQCKSGVCGI